MKTKIESIFLPFVLLMVVIGCSKKTDVDPRDQYVGTWTEISATSDGVSQPVTTPEVFNITKSTGSSTGIVLSAVTTIPATVSTVGFVADNTKIPIGTYTFSDKSQSTAYISNLTGNVSNGQLTIKYTEYAKSSTAIHSIDDTETYAKK